MRVLLFGHSYVNHLRELNNWDRELTLADNSKIDIEFLFKGYSGKDFKYLLDHDGTFNVIREQQPDAIVVILGVILLIILILITKLNHCLIDSFEN